LSRIRSPVGLRLRAEAFNAQIAVDSAAQIIVAAEITQESNDKRQLAPMLEQVGQNTGSRPAAASADTGYFSAEQVTDERVQGINLYVAIGKQKRGESEVASEMSPLPEDSERAQVRQKLQTEQGKAIYRMRKAIVEPVFGQIKEWRGFRRFSLRSLEKAGAEWKLICLTHNLLKLFRSGWVPQAA
jgi:hypothetical protein